MSRYKVGIAGGAGYTAGELIRILIRHPDTELMFVQSESNTGKPVTDVHDDLLGSCDLTFSQDPDFNIDVLFLCKGHGESVKFLKNHKVSSTTRIIDLSQDFRIEGSHEEIAKSCGGFVYGLCELQPGEISQARNIANPGCFATCIQLGLLPLASENLIRDDIHVSAITGSTGAGQGLTETVHFSYRNNNISIYKPFQHQHLGEIYQTLQLLQKDFSYQLNFVPYRGNFTRGIMASIYMKSGITTFEARDLFKTYYQNAEFVRVSPRNLHLKQVVNTNNCYLYIEKIEDKLLVVSIIDNLVKGASGQAVQNMNLMLGLEESAGLQLKASAF